MTTPTSDGEYLREANAQRQHELSMAKVEADKQTELARLANDRAAERRTWWGFFCAGLLALAFIATLAGAISWNVDRDRQKNAEVAKECVQNGNIWLNQSCLITRK